MENSFLNLISTLVELPVDQKEKFQKLISLKEIDREEDFISAGDTPKSIAFVKKGLFRYYYRSESGEEFTKAFFPENSILSSYSAIVENRESYFTIEALEDSLIEVVDYEKLQHLFKEYPKWSSFLLAMLQKGFIAKEAREREFLLFDAEQRYRSFLSRFPNFDQRVKQHIVASYLGITPESLSRLRRKMGLLT